MNAHAASERYARAALADECAILAGLRAGRNAGLNRAAFVLGQLVGAGQLDEREVETALFEAAVANGYVAKDGAAQARASIRSGLEKGRLEPRARPADRGLVGDGPNGSRRARRQDAPRRAARDPEVPPDWTEPGADGQPRLTAIGRDTIGPLPGEVRRHVYRRGDQPARIKVKTASGWSNHYRVRRPSDGATGWQARKPASYRLVPYIGPADAIDPLDPDFVDDPLLWPEGERDVDTLAAAGGLAFTCGGASDVPATCADWLRGRHVVVLTDNDEPGRTCGARKVALAARVAASVRLIDFPELDAGGDVTDWLTGHGGTLDALMARAVTVEQDRPCTLEDEQEDRFPPPADVTDAPALSIRATPFVLRDPRTIQPRRWLYGRRYIRRFTTATIAPGGLGKTSLVLVEALAMVTGKPLLGVRVPERLCVWVWNGEDPQEEIERRLAAACVHYGITVEDIGDRLFIDSGRETPIVIAQKVGEGTTVHRPLVEAMTAEIRARRIDLMVLDPFVSCHAVPENDNGAIDKVVKECGGIAEAANCGFEFVHHVRKASAGQAAYTVEDARGGSALIGGVRSARVLNAMSLEEASQAGVERERRRRFFRVDDGKANMQPPAEAAAWHELLSVPLGNEISDLPGDIVGVVAAWKLPRLSDNLQHGDVRKVQDAIAAGSWAEDARAGNWAGKAVAPILGLDAGSKGDRRRIEALLSLWTKNGCLKTETRHNTRTGRDQTMLVVGEVL